jgi:hypothetical protein
MSLWDNINMSSKRLLVNFDDIEENIDLCHYHYRIEKIN